MISCWVYVYLSTKHSSPAWYFLQRQKSYQHAFSCFQPWVGDFFSRMPSKVLVCWRSYPRMSYRGSFSRSDLLDPSYQLEDPSIVRYCFQHFRYPSSTAWNRHLFHHWRALSSVYSCSFQLSVYVLHDHVLIEANPFVLRVFDAPLQKAKKQAPIVLLLNHPLLVVWIWWRYQRGPLQCHSTSAPPTPLPPKCWISQTSLYKRD